MELQLAKMVQEIEKAKEPTNSLPACVTTLGLTADETGIVILKYKSARFGEMSPVKLLPTGKALLIKIAIITGWQNPEGPSLNVLVTQFVSKLAESYSNVNTDEVEYAFRTYGSAVKDWGKLVNLSLIDEVMAPYLASRREVSAKEEQKNPVQALLSPTEPLTDYQTARWLISTRWLVRAGNYSVHFIPVPLYEWLDKKGKITKSAQEKFDYLARAVELRQGQLSDLVNNENSLDNRNRLSAFMVMKQANTLTGDEIGIVKNLAKKCVVYDMLKSKG